MDIKDAINNTKNIYMSESSLEVLMDFERVLDELDVYGFENWMDGELVEGPTIEKYWVTCKFMWPRKKMPNPEGAERLIPYGIKITYEKTKIDVPVEIKTPDDFRSDGTRRGKLMPCEGWIVSIRMPQDLIMDVEEGSIEIAGNEFDIEDINSSYNNDIDQSSLERTDTPANDEDQL